MLAGPLGGVWDLLSIVFWNFLGDGDGSYLFKTLSPSEVPSKSSPSHQEYQHLCHREHHCAPAAFAQGGILRYSMRYVHSELLSVSRTWEISYLVFKLHVVCVWCVWYVWVLYMCICVMWRSEDNLQEVVPTLNHVGCWVWTRVVRLGSKCAYQVSHCMALSLYLIYCSGSCLRNCGAFDLTVW